MTGAHTHGTEELCEAGLDLYTRALREGRVSSAEGDAAPCPVDLGLLQPDVADLRWLRPIAPAFALHRLLRGMEERIADERRREERLASLFEPLMRIGSGHPAAAGGPSISVLSGFERINTAIAEAMADAAGRPSPSSPTTAGTPAPAWRPPWDVIRLSSTAAAVSAPSTSTRSGTPRGDRPLRTTEG